MENYLYQEKEQMLLKKLKQNNFEVAILDDGLQDNTVKFDLNFCLF